VENYIASCKIIKQGITIFFPENLFTKKPFLEVTYKVKKEGVLCNNKYIPCQNFCKRVLIGVDILLKLNDRNLTVESLYNDNVPAHNFLFLMSKIENDLSKIEKSKEIELAKVCLDPNTEICEEVENAYSLIIDLYACGGIKC
jgi:hypothetical protein